MPHPVEEEIVALIKKKDKAFVGMIYDHYGNNLFGVIKTILKDEALAQDTLQESFIKIWKNAEQYDPSKARLFTWLLRICRNTAIDKLRIKQKQAQRKIQIDDSNVNTLGTSSFDPQLLDMKDLLAGLDQKYQAVIHLLFFQGMTQVEASKALDIPLGTVKSRLKIGLRTLRVTFGKDALPILIILTLAS
ncbi:MAG: RNA polymerase sigma factor [Saprospiraceae bacterium]